MNYGKPTQKMNIMKNNLGDFFQGLIFRNKDNSALVAIFFIFTLLLVAYHTYSIGFTVRADGLRHLMYIIDNRPWNESFVYTYFGSYDPWIVWDYFLYFLQYPLGISTYNTVLLVNFLMFLALTICSFLFLTRDTKLNYWLISFLTLILIAGSMRYTSLRPDSLNGLYLFFSLYFLSGANQKVGHKRFLVLTLLYSFSYYISWFFIAHMVLFLLLLKHYKTSFFSLSIIMFSGIFNYIIGGQDYLNVMDYVLHYDKMRRELGIEIFENTPFFSFMKVYKEFVGNSLLYLSLLIIPIVIMLKVTYYDKAKIEGKSILYYSMLFLAPLFFTQSRFLLILYPLYYIFSLIFSLDKRDDYYKGLFIFTVMIFLSTLLYPLYTIKGEFNKTYESYRKATSDLNLTNELLVFDSLNKYVFLSYFDNRHTQQFPSFSIEAFTGDKKKGSLFNSYCSGSITEEEMVEFILELGGDYYIIKKTPSWDSKKYHSMDYVKLTNIGAELISDTKEFSIFKINKTKIFNSKKH